LFEKWYNGVPSAAPEVLGFLDIHLVFNRDSGNLDYPINFLRNVAMDYSPHQWCFVVDADAIPSTVETEFWKDLRFSMDYRRLQSKDSALLFRSSCSNLTRRGLQKDHFHCTCP
jgi:hypothetical protein